MSKSLVKKKILFAAGGTGGHLFPAQTVAAELLKEGNIEVLFAGAGLKENRYFDREKFSYKEVVSTTPFRGGLFKAIRSIGILLSGILSSLRLLKEEKPDLIIGFGSFHTFPVLCAARLKKIPILLFESNSIPGKVVRFFSKKAVCTALFFPEANRYLKGKTVAVEMPQAAQKKYSPEEARRLFGLDPDKPTLLVFGGSQGAKAINNQILSFLKEKGSSSFQLIHFTGNAETAAEVEKVCNSLSIPCYVRPFEKQMAIAWSGADLVLCRSGAMTVAELMHYEVPGILVPYPFASDDHQLKNALVMEKEVKGTLHLLEKDLSAEILAEKLLPLLTSDSPQRQEMKKAIEHFKEKQRKNDLSNIILTLCKNNTIS